MALTINAEDVVHETLDEEVVIVNLRNGRYYSLMDSGALLWAGLQNGFDGPHLATLLCGHYAVDSETSAATVADFLAQLTEAGLIGQGSAADAPPSEDLVLERPEKLVFHPPVLTEHEDMEGLLLLDPVHEVADAGWPAVKG